MDNPLSTRARNLEPRLVAEFASAMARQRCEHSGLVDFTGITINEHARFLATAIMLGKKLNDAGATIAASTAA